MANYESLKSAIRQVIKSNGNEEITGQVLQDTLISLVSSVGQNATFAGVAVPTTNPQNPDGNVFYLATQNGTYSNFGGIVVADEVAILSNVGGSWAKINTRIGTDLYKSADLVMMRSDNYLPFDAFTSCDFATDVRAWCYRGQRYDETPKFVGASAPVLHKGVITIAPNDFNTYYVRIKGAVMPNEGYRTIAIYNANDEIITEVSDSGDFVFLVPFTCKISASCESVTKYPVRRGSVPVISMHKVVDTINDNIDSIKMMFVTKLNLPIANIGDALACQFTRDNASGNYTIHWIAIPGSYFPNWSVSSVRIGKVRDWRNKLRIVTNSLWDDIEVHLAINNATSWVYNIDGFYKSYDGVITINRFSAIEGGYVYNPQIGGGVADTDDLYLMFGTRTIPNNDVSFYITDTEVTKYIDTDIIGQKSTTDNKPLSGKTFWTIWDSLGHNTWQARFAQDSGAQFYPELNTLRNKPISWGGSNSAPSGDDATQQRAINLVSYKGQYPMDYVFIENVNDASIVNGSINDAPFMRSQHIILPTRGNTFNSYSEASTYLNNNFASLVNAIPQHKNGTVISMPYSAGSEIRGSKIRFIGTATASGQATITWWGNNFAIDVAVGDTAQNIINKFLLYSFGAGVTDIDNGDGSMSIFYYTTHASARITAFNGGGTGISATITDTTGGGYVDRYFTGYTDAEWTNTDKWAYSISLYATYKGLIEYLRRELPTSKLFWVIPFTASIDLTSTALKNADGTWSNDKFLQSQNWQRYKALFDVQREVCKYYELPIIDIVANGHIGINNFETYFNSNNVHPKIEGYNRYADTILATLPPRREGVY